MFTRTRKYKAIQQIIVLRRKTIISWGVDGPKNSKLIAKIGVIYKFRGKNVPKFSWRFWTRRRSISVLVIGANSFAFWQFSVVSAFSFSTSFCQRRILLKLSRMTRWEEPKNGGAYFENDKKFTCLSVRGIRLWNRIKRVVLEIGV
jgi:hypothetical protein